MVAYPSPYEIKILQPYLFFQKDPMQTVKSSVTLIMVDNQIPRIQTGIQEFVPIESPPLALQCHPHLFIKETVYKSLNHFVCVLMILKKKQMINHMHHVIEIGLNGNACEGTLAFDNYLLGLYDQLKGLSSHAKVYNTKIILQRDSVFNT